MPVPPGPARRRWRRPARLLFWAVAVPALLTRLALDGGGSTLLGLDRHTAGYSTASAALDPASVTLQAFDVAARPVVPDRLDRLTVTATPEERATVLAALSASAYADTLRALFGWPAGGLALSEPHPGAPGTYRVGSYTGVLDLVQLDPTELSPLELRGVLAHELTHRVQRLAGLEFGDWWGRQHVPLPPPGTYARSTVLEHQAEAMATAVGWLSITAAPPAPATAPRVAARQAEWALRDVERTVPGTVALARVLLSHAVYAGHPLRTGRLRLPSLDLSPQPAPWDWTALHRATGPGVTPVLVHEAADPAFGRPAARRVLAIWRHLAAV